MTTTTTPEVQAYAAAVRAALADLPPAVAAELLDGLEPHLQEVVAEGGGSLLDALGPPDRYAAELRASAGIHEPLAIGTGAAAPVAPGAPGAPAPPTVTDAATPTERGAGSTLRERWPLVLVALSLAAVVVAALRTDDLAPGEVLVPVVAIGAVWVLAVAVVRRRVAPAWRDASVVGLVVAALGAAVVLGGQLADDPEDALPDGVTDVFLPTTAATVTLPDLVGLQWVDAVGQLQSMGLQPSSNGDADFGDVVVAQIPAPGSVVPVGATVSVEARHPDAVATTAAPPVNATTTLPTVPETAVVEPTTTVPAPTTTAPPPG